MAGGKPRASEANHLHSDDDDPIVATYGVFARPSLAAGQSLMVLQYVNKVSANPACLQHQRLRALRNKRDSRMVEADIDLDPMAPHFDKVRGTDWGVDLGKSVEARKGGSLGLPGGFSAQPRGAGGGAGRARNPEEAKIDFIEALRQDKVLCTQTYGGVARDAGDETSGTMLGVFQGSESRTRLL